MPAPENTARAGPSLLDLPPELILERLLPILPSRDLASLSGTNKLFSILCSDESVWSQKTQADFSFSPSLLAPPPSSSGWSKRVYLGMRSPRTFVWGSTDNARLGTQGAHMGERGVRTFRRWVDRPVELTDSFPSAGKGRTWGHALRDGLARGLENMRGDGSEGTVKGMRVGVVDLQAGGWSFTARDMDGGVWVWGQLDGTIIRFSAPSWEDSHCQVPEPTRMPLPCRADAISAGRRHLLVLDEDNLIWEQRSWGRAYRHTARELTSPTNTGSSGRPQHIVQLSTGWSHSACLAADGAIHVWFPFSANYEATLTPDAELHGPLGVEADDQSRSLRWGTVGDVVLELEQIPKRPTADEEWTDVEADGRTRAELEDEWREWTVMRDTKTLADKEKVVKIACGLDFVLALKGNGEVWFRHVTEGERNVTWTHLPFFSSPTISHITAQYESITSYSTTTSSVFHARLPERATPGFGAVLRPTPLPGLQGKGVIQVALGDYHFAALTSSGELYTWGQGAQGQLGLGDTQKRGQTRVGEPEKVTFSKNGGDGEDDCFVFGVTAAGWHTGALILGDPKKMGETEGEQEEIKSAIEEDEGRKQDGPMPGAFPQGGQQGMGVHPFTPPIFRMGFAGRGAMRGRIPRRNQGGSYGTGTNAGLTE